MALFAGVEYALFPSDIKDPTLRPIGSDGSKNARATKLKLGKITLNDFRVHLEDRELEHVPDIILKKESQLRGLFLSRNRITAVPRGLHVLKMLQKLVLSGNCIVELPTELGSLVYLESLWVDHNSLDTIPVEIGKLVRLRELNLDANPLRKGLPKGPKTFSEVWRTKETSENIEEGSTALQHERTPLHLLKKQTQKVMQYLQDNMSSDMLSLVKKKQRKVKQKIIRKKIRVVCRRADLERIEDACKEANEVELEQDELEQAYEAKKVLQGMNAALTSRDLKAIKSAISDWFQYCDSFNIERKLSNGPDLDRAQKEKKKIEREMEREVWKKNEGSTKVEKDTKVKHLPFRLGTSMSEPSNLGNQTQTSFVPTTTLQKKMTFDDWLKQKSNSNRAKFSQLQNMRHMEYKAAMAKKQRVILQSLKRAELEDKWPSRIVEAYPPGYFNIKRGKRVASATPYVKPKLLKDPIVRSRSRCSPWEDEGDLFLEHNSDLILQELASQNY